MASFVAAVGRGGGLGLCGGPRAGGEGLPKSSLLLAAGMAG